MVAITLVMWVSGLSSAFIDNIPFTTMMIPVINALSEGKIAFHFQFALFIFLSIIIINIVLIV